MIGKEDMDLSDRLDLYESSLVKIRKCFGLPMRRTAQVSCSNEIEITFFEWKWRYRCRRDTIYFRSFTENDEAKKN